MSYEICTTYDAHREKHNAKKDISTGLSNLVTSVDGSLEWITERLDRKFVSAMESSFAEDPEKKQEMKLFQRAVLIVLCAALGAAAVSIKFAVESSTIWAFFG
jgi:hypothetical protein